MAEEALRETEGGIVREKGYRGDDAVAASDQTIEKDTTVQTENATKLD